MEKKILIVGCYHSMNTGVMAMAEAIVQHYSNAKVYILSSSSYFHLDKERYGIYPNVELVNAEWLQTGGLVNRLKILLASQGLSLYKRINAVIKEVDVILDISGDSISNDYGTKSIFFSLFPSFIAPKNKVIYAPQTIGPFTSGLQQRIVEKAFRNAKAVYLREERSLEKIKGTNVKIAGVYADLAFLLKPREAIDVAPIPQKTIAIGVSALVKRFGRADFLALYKDLVDKSLSEGYNILLVNHVSTKQGNDIKIAKELKTNFFSKNDRVIFYDTNFRASEWKHLISQCSAIISARMHPIVHALASGVPALNLSYNHKSLGVVHDRFAPYGRVVDINDDKLMDSVDQFIASIDSFDRSDFERKRQRNHELSARFFEDLERV